MQQVADWLGTLGLGQYAQQFAENDIQFSILPDLTDQDLKELGVSLGHRRLILRAIAELSIGKSKPDPTDTISPPIAPRETAERRQVTVMFSDLVGSTALSARMDPEDLREVISAYQKCVAETVQRFGGFVAKYMGDGVLGLFRLPPSPRGRRRAGRARRPGVGRCCRCPEDPCATSDARRHRNGAGGRRRSDRVRRFSGASNRRRDAEPCGALAGRCRAEQRCHCGEHSEARRQPVRA